MADTQSMHLALRLARRGYGTTSPNPMVGAVLVRHGKIIGRGWHHRAGCPHAEIEALEDARRHGHDPRGATLYVTLEPCSTHGRTPPCTQAIIASGIKRVVIGATDPNPKHAGRAFKILHGAGVAVTRGVLADECARLNESFNHWITHGTPFVTVKAAMTLDGKIATAAGESKWITGEPARAHGMHLREGADAILVGINTILADDPSLTFRSPKTKTAKAETKLLRRIILDSTARTPLTARVVTGEYAALTTIVVSPRAPKHRVVALAKRVNVIVAPLVRKPSRITHHALPRRSPAKAGSRIPLPWLLKKLGSENVARLLVEGGGEVNASFLLEGLAQRVAFFYAPKILGGRDSLKGVGGEGILRLADIIQLRDVEWKHLGADLFLTARVDA